MPTSRKEFLKYSTFAAASTFFSNKMFAKSFSTSKKFAVDTTHPKDCSINLINPIYPVAYINEADFTYHKGTYPGIIKDQLYYQEENVEDCLPSPPPNTDLCGPTNNHDPDDSVLRYRVYYPRSTYENPTSGHDYDEVPLPCVAVFHPGGFSECLDHIQPGMKTICREFARRGFIAFTVNYRAGRLKDETDSSRITAQQELCAYRAMQDGRGALRSIVKRDITDKHDNRFKINLDQFFVGGLSAGGVIVLGAAYYRTQGMINSVFVTAPSSLTIEQALGHMNADYYYGEPGPNLNDPTYMPVIRGVMNGWGGITIPNGFNGGNDFGTVEKNFFAGGGGGNRINPPTIGFAGYFDLTVPFRDDNGTQLQPHSISTSPINYRRQSFCLEQAGNYILKSPTGANNVYIKQCSAQNMYYILKELNRFTELYADCDMAHGINNIATDNFGVSATTIDDIYLYMVQRSAIFFQTIMQPAPNDPFLPFNHRGRSVFRGVVPDINNRICTECDGSPASDVCNVTEDPLCGD